jgi:hypothetical protein
MFTEMVGYAVFGLFLVVSTPALGAQASSPWLTRGAYVRYSQVFQWGGENETTPMMWNVTSLSGGLANVFTTSYDFNVTGGKVVIFPVESRLVVNEETNEIVGVESGVNVKGYPVPFWIDPNVGLGSSIDAYFGTNATIQASQSIEVMGTARSCWTVVLEWPYATMQRWYDKSTGIVLRIDTNLTRAGVRMRVVETATESNLQMLRASGVSSLSLVLYLAAAVIAVGVVLLGVEYYYRREIGTQT